MEDNTRVEDTQIFLRLAPAEKEAFIRYSDDRGLKHTDMLRFLVKACNDGRMDVAVIPTNPENQ